MKITNPGINPSNTSGPADDDREVASTAPMDANITT